MSAVQPYKPYSTYDTTRDICKEIAKKDPIRAINVAAKIFNDIQREHAFSDILEFVATNLSYSARDIIELSGSIPEESEREITLSCLAVRLEGFGMTDKASTIKKVVANDFHNRIKNL